MISNFYGYDGHGYFRADSLQPYSGYWVKAWQSGKLVSGSGGAFQNLPAGKLRVVADHQIGILGYGTAPHRGSDDPQLLPGSHFGVIGRLSEGQDLSERSSITISDGECNQQTLYLIQAEIEKLSIKLKHIDI